MILSTFRRLFAMLQMRERRHFFLILVMITVSGLADMIGVAAILPFLSVLSNPGSIEDTRILAWLYDVMQPEDIGTFLFLLGTGVFAIIILGTIIKLGTMYTLARFSHMRKYHIGQRLLVGYLRQPYAWFLQRHSSDLIKTVIQEVDQMVGMTMVPAMRILAQAVSIAFLLLLLLIVEPTIALLVFGVFGGAYISIFVFVRKRLTWLGRMRVDSNTARFRIAGEALGGLKDVKLMGLEERYATAYRRPALQHAQTLVGTQVISELPRYALEAITFGGMVALILFLLRGGSETAVLADIIPILGLFAIAGLRMLPAIQNIYHSFASIRAGQAVLHLISDELADLERLEQNRLPPAGVRARAPQSKTNSEKNNPALCQKLELRNASYSYPDTDRPILDELTLEIEARTTVGIVGGTGAGKTTAIDVILGLLALDDGGLYVDGFEIKGDLRRPWQDRIGYVPQQVFLVDDTIAANIAFGVPPDMVDLDAVERAARLACLHDFIIAEMPQSYDSFVGERGLRLSGGQKQRIGIARALYHDPDILVFDEATSALDTITENSVMEAVASLAHAKTIIMIAHRLTTVEKCDQIFLLQGGKLADKGTYDELLEKNEVFRKMARVTSGN